MPTSHRRVTVPFCHVLAPLLALTFAGCSYHYHYGEDEQGQAHHQQGPGPQPNSQPMPMQAMNGAPPQQPQHMHHQQGPAPQPNSQPMPMQPTPMPAMNGAPVQQPQRTNRAPEHGHDQRDQEVANNDRFHREVHQRLDRLSERLARLEKLLSDLAQSPPNRR